MSKYVDKDKVLEYIIFGVVGKDITCGELTRAIESLPTIEVSEDGEDYLRGYNDGWYAHEVITNAKLHIDKPRGFTLKTEKRLWELQRGLYITQMA